MSKFKEMKVTFKVTEDVAYKAGGWKEDRSYIKFVVNRYESGATHYGDHSGHTLYLDGAKGTMPKYFDTRYEGISTDKDAWIAFWKEYIEREYVLDVEPEGYEEKYVDERED